VRPEKYQIICFGGSRCRQKTKCGRLQVLFILTSATFYVGRGMVFQLFGPGSVELEKNEEPTPIYQITGKIYRSCLACEYDGGRERKLMLRGFSRGHKQANECCGSQTDKGGFVMYPATSTLLCGVARFEVFKLDNDHIYSHTYIVRASLSADSNTYIQYVLYTVYTAN
jgi:hypothetical protein